jgi:hypothetical protein
MKLGQELAGGRERERRGEEKWTRIEKRKDNEEGDKNGGTHASCARLSGRRSRTFRSCRVCLV